MHVAGGGSWPYRRKSWFDYIFDRLVVSTALRRSAAIAVSCFLTLSTAVSAQEPGIISGRVIDARTGVGLDKVLVLIENGGPSVAVPSSRSFGLKVIVASIEQQLGGKAAFEWNAGGLRCAAVVL